MRSIIQQAILIFGVAFLTVACTKSYTKEEINKLFEPITSKYEIKIVYEIDEDFGPILIGGDRAHFNKAKPIDHGVLVRYPSLLKEAFDKYPASVIKEYLSAIYFAKELDCNGLKYGGTYDPFQKIVYLVNNGKKSDDLAVATFHHEFSSILLKRNGFFLNPWLEQNPTNFKYFQEKKGNSKEIYAGKFEGTPEDYKMGFLNAYSQASFEEDFNEYATMIFTYPSKFQKIMNQYPRVRKKFLIWLDFYHKIDPIFSEQYLLGKN